MKTGSTPLVYSLQQSNWELAQTLIEHGAGINIATNSGMFPLDFVLTTNNVQLAKDLLKRQAESGVKTEYSDKDVSDISLWDLSFYHKNIYISECFPML